jgi:hypothetical protein
MRRNGSVSSVHDGETIPAAPSAELSFEHGAHAGSFAVREARATAPAPGPEALRTASLDLLKLALCDLCGASTISVWKHTDGSLMARELAGDDESIRVIGGDWPLQGVTMAGLHRLDDLQACVERAVADGVGGDLIEAGTWRGGSSILMRATLDALGADGRTVWVADSFEGFRAASDERLETGQLPGIDFLAVPLEEVRANFARFGLRDGVRFLPGFFEETLPRFEDRSWSIVRLDGDSFEATRTTLAELYPNLAVGGYLIVDDYGALEECQRAVDAFRSEHGIEDPLEAVDWTCVRWRRTSDMPIARPPAPADRGEPLRAPPARAGRSATVHEILFDREHAALPQRLLALEIQREQLEEALAAANARTGAAEAEAARLSGSPLAGARHWLRRRLERRRSA